MGHKKQRAGPSGQGGRWLGSLLPLPPRSFVVSAVVWPFPEPDAAQPGLRVSASQQVLQKLRT